MSDITLRDVKKFLKESPNSPRTVDQMDVYDKAVSSTVDDEFLSENNFGLGKLSFDERWQQVQSYRDGMYGEAAFSGPIEEQAILYTKYALVETEQAPEDELSPREWRRERAEENWREMDKTERLEAIAEHTGMLRDWVPPHLRMMMARHELSRSSEGALLSGVFPKMEENMSHEVASEVARKLGGDA